MNTREVLKIIGFLLALHGVQIAIFSGPSIRIVIQLILYAMVISFFIMKRDLWDGLFCDKRYIIEVFLLYGIFLFLRGIYGSDTYEQYRYVAVDFLPFVTLPIFWAIGSKPINLIIFLKYLVFYCAAMSVLFLLKGPSDKHENLRYIVYASYVLPLIVIFGVFETKIRIFIISIGVISLLFDLSNRTNVVGILSAFFIGLSYLSLIRLSNGLYIYMAKKCIEMLGVFFMIAPIILVFSAMLLNFNIFEFFGGSDAERIRDEGFSSIDSRTGLYLDAYRHMIFTGDWIFGSGPSVLFQTELIDYSDDYKDGRLGGFEASILSFFVFGGLVQVIIIFCIFWWASRLAIIGSQSWAMKLIGLYISLRWVFCFIENPLGFNIYWIVTFLFIGACFSPVVRSLTDEKIRNIFVN